MQTAKLTLLTIVLTAAASAWPSAQEKKTWTVDDLFRRNIGTREDQDTLFTPHKIIGNLYYVGTRSLGSFLITTPQGHILINSDLEANVPLIRAQVAASTRALSVAWPGSPVHAGQVTTICVNRLRAFILVAAVAGQPLASVTCNPATVSASVCGPPSRTMSGAASR